MDPASIAGLLLQISQLPLQSGTALYQFIRDAKNATSHIASLKHELLSLSNACKLVRGQLESLAKHYSFGEEDGEGGVSIWASIENKLKSCSATLGTLDKALEELHCGGSNFVTQGVRQFKLNLKQDQIIAMKRQIQSHTSALQVCLMVMDIKVSHLASQKVGKTLRKKIGKLEKMIRELKSIMVAQTESVEDQLILASEQEDVHIIREGHSSWKAMTSSRSPDMEHSQEPWILLDRELVQTPMPDKLGDELVLQCAQKTLSQATSLCEESLDRSSLRMESDDEGAPVIEDVSPGTMAELFALQEDAIDAISPMRAIPGGACSARPEAQRNVPDIEKLDPTVSTIRSRLIVAPLNMPPKVRSAFVQMQVCFGDQNPSTTTLAEHNPSIRQLAPPRAEYKALRKTKSLEVVQKTTKRRPRKSKNNLRMLKNPKPKIKPTVLGMESHDSLCSIGQSNIANGAPLQYLTHIEQNLQDMTHYGVSPSRQHVLQDLQPDDAVLLPSRRVALTGRLGIGKSYVAAAHVHCLLQCFKYVPILWISESHLKEDCKAITELLRMKPPTDVSDLWKWLGKIIRCIPRRVTGPWLVVIDGVNSDLADDSGLGKLFDLEYDSNGYILMTTRHISTAQSFVKDGSVVHVNTLDGKDAANLLAMKSSVPKDFEFDMLARALDYDPFVIVQVRTFLEMTDMTVSEFYLQLGIILDEQNWSRNGQAKLAAKSLGRKHSMSDCVPAGAEGLSSSTLSSVMRAVLNPSWLILFDALRESHPESGELLNAITAQGEIRFPAVLLGTSDDISISLDLLKNQCLLVSMPGEIMVPRLLVIAHRVWTIEQGKMGWREAQTSWAPTNEHRNQT